MWWKKRTIFHENFGNCTHYIDGFQHVFIKILIGKKIYYINQNYFEANKCYIEDAILRKDKELGKLFLARAKKYQKTTEQKNELAFIEKKLNELKE